jgi:hypothetical protein
MDNGAKGEVRPYLEKALEACREAFRATEAL